MRSLLLFLLVFAVGLGVLLWVQSRSGEPSTATPIAPAPLRPGPARPAVPEPAVPEPVGPPAGGIAGAETGTAAQDGPASEPLAGDAPAPEAGPAVPVASSELPDGGQVRVGGEISVVRYQQPGGKLLYRLHAQDVRSVAAGTYELTGVSMEFHDRETGELLTTLEAASARAEARLTEAGFDLADDKELTLYEVDAVLHGGTPLAPLRTRVPELDLRIEDQYLRSDSEVLVEGRGLQITGTGLEIDRATEHLRISREPRVRLRFEDGTRGVLAAEGELSVSSSGGEQVKQVELDATGDARLDFRAGTAARLSADSVRLVGSVLRVAPEAEPDEDPEGDSDPAHFTPHTVVGTGGATLTAVGEDEQRSVARGERAELVFDDEGAPERAILEGDPRLSLDLSPSSVRELAELDPALASEGERQRLPLEISGAGPLEVALSPQEAVNFPGPVELRMPTVDVVVRARTGVTGSRDATRRRMALAIRGDVVVEHGESSLTAPELVIDAVQDATGARSGRLTSSGPTRTVGELLGTDDEPGQGRPFVLTTDGGLVVERDDHGFRLPRAEGVTLDVRGEEPFLAHAELIEGFDEASLSFRARGKVGFASIGGEASGEELVVENGERAVLTGGARPARIDFDGGSVEAAVVESSKTELRAREGARMRFSAEDSTYDLAARWVRIDRSDRIEDQNLEGLVVLDALGEVVVGVTSGEGWRAEVASDVLRVVARPKQAEGAGARAGEPGDEDLEGLEELEPTELLAEGRVNFGYAAELTLNGQGERLLLRGDGSGELSPASGDPAGEVHLDGRLPDDDSEFSMSARQVEFSRERLIATAPDIGMQGIEVGGAASPAGEVRVVAGRMSSDESGVLLTDGVHVSQRDGSDRSWSLYADKIMLRADVDAEDARSAEALRDVLAWDGFTARFGDQVQASGDTLRVIREAQTIEIRGNPAIVELQAFQWASTWFELDLRTSVVKAGPGEVRGAEATEDSWHMRYTSIEPVEYPGETIQVIREPVLESENEELRASWAMFWVDNSEWSRLSRRAVGRDGGPAIPLPEEIHRRPAHPDSLFGRIGNIDAASWLREVYLEGNVSYSKRGERIARADSIYLDLVDGHGWIRRIDLTVDLPFMEDRQLKLRARWMRHSADGSFVASNAVATTCDHEEPHYVVRIGDLEIDPRKKPRDERPEREGRPEQDDEELDELDGWEISTRDTSVRLFDRLEVPLPRIAVPVTTDLEIDTKKVSLGGLHPLQFGTDSKLGTFIGTTVSRELGWLAKSVNRLLSGPDVPSFELEGQTDYRASWNRDRGVLLGVSSELSVEGRYHLEADIDGLFDEGDDEGLIQVRDDDPTEWRAWYRTRGRYLIDAEEWVDLVVSIQEDAAVQSEFFESEFLDFEERETYLHWRESHGADYFAATVEAYPDDFRTEVVGQDALYARSRTAIAGLNETVPVLYSSKSSLGHLTRELGDPRYPSPFDPRYLTTDGFGEEDTLRLDSRHRFEAPFALGVGGVRATPFLEGRGTAWDIDPVTSASASQVTPEDPTRLGLLGGVELGTTFWRYFGDTVRHVVSPFVGWREDLWTDGDDDPLVRFDQVESPLQGRFFDLGVRSHLGSRRDDKFLDVELVGTHGDDLPSGLSDGWQPLEVNIECLTDIYGVGFGVVHDARYDLEQDNTPYSRTIFGLDPIPALGIDLGYHSARDLAGVTLYNAFSTGASYSFSDKWELEGRYVFSTLGDGRLSSEFGVRRLGHDFVFEVSTRFREGEGGGTSIQFDVIPLLAYDEGGLSLVERWRARGY